MSDRIRLSLLATFAGWFAGTLFTILFFEIPELWQNAAPGSRVRDLVEGLPLWAGFTLLVCAGVWCVLVLPVALLAPAETIVRRRWLLTLGASAAGVLVLGWRLGTWKSLFDRSPETPFTRLFVDYAGFAVALSSVTALVYAHLLRRSIEKRSGQTA